MIQTQVTLAADRQCAEYEQTLETNLEELGRLSRMVSDMLFLARAEAHQYALECCRVDLRAETDRVVSLFEPSADEKRVRLEVSGSGSVEGDATMVQRVINNLLSNALRHVTPGGTVAVAVLDKVTAVEVRVENSGEPIPADVAARMFDRFYRGDSSREHCGEGTGLGLALVRSIMRLHGGDVGVAHVAGVNRFSLHFPRSTRKAAAATARRRGVIQKTIMK
jgi:two-component system heavy metal sensor histidine kinase CusS